MGLQSYHLLQEGFKLLTESLGNSAKWITTSQRKLLFCVTATVAAYIVCVLDHGQNWKPIGTRGHHKTCWEIAGSNSPSTRFEDLPHVVLNFRTLNSDLRQIPCQVWSHDRRGQTTSNLCPLHMVHWPIFRYHGEKS